MGVVAAGTQPHLEGWQVRPLVAGPRAGHSRRKDARGGHYRNKRRYFEAVRASSTQRLGLKLPGGPGCQLNARQLSPSKARYALESDDAGGMARGRLYSANFGWQCVRKGGFLKG